MSRVSDPISPLSRTTASRLTPFKYPSNLTRSWPPSESPNLLNHGLQGHLQTLSITASKCISKLDRLQPLTLHSHGLCGDYSKLARLQPPSSHVHRLHVHLQTRSVTAAKLIPKLSRLRCSSSHHQGLKVNLYVHSITVWWNSGGRRQTAQYQHSTKQRMESEGNCWEWVVLARGTQE